MAAGRRMTVQEALGFAERVNEVVVDGRPLKEHRVLGRYDLTPFYTMTTLFSAGRQGIRTRASTRRPFVMLYLLLRTGIAFIVTCVKRPPVLLYAIDKVSSTDKDHDHRADAFYAFVKRNGLAYTEVMHTLPRESFLPNLRTRGRGALYIEAILMFARRFAQVPQTTYDLSMFGEEERELARTFVESRRRVIARDAIAIRMLTAILSVLRPKLVLTLDDFRESVLLTIAAKEVGIPVHWFQHGHFTNYHQGILSGGRDASDVPIPDVLHVWSSFWKDRLRTIGTYLPPERIRVSGAKETKGYSAHAPRMSETLNILIPYESSGPIEEIASYMKRALRDERITFYFKRRVDRPGDDQLGEYGLTPSDRLVVIDEVVSVRDRLDAVIGTYSTFLYDMIAEGLPVGLLRTSSDYGAGMTEAGAASWIDPEVPAYESLAALAALSAGERLERFHLVYGTEPLNLGEVLDQVAQEAGVR